MKQLIPKPARNRPKAAALAFGLRGLSRLLMLIGWALHLAARGAYHLAAAADRSAARISAR
jgi:hypothetical protein